MSINVFKDYPGFIGHTEITDTGAAPFNTYLYIECGYGHTREAYALSDDCPLDIEFFIKQAFKDECGVIVYPQNGGPNYAAIITGGRAPGDGVVWASRDFYFED